MARPSNKKDLIIAINNSYEKLNALISGFSEEELNKEFNFLEDRDKNIKDVIIHLYEWQELLLNFVKKNISGNSVDFLPKPYNWKNYKEMNEKFVIKHKNTSLVEAKQMLNRTHNEVLELVKIFTNEELFTKKRYAWTKTTTLGSYIISSSSSHYEWAIKKIRRYKLEGKRNRF